MTSDLQFQVPRLVYLVSLPGLQLVLLDMQVLTLLAHHMQQALKLLEKLRVRPPNGLHFVTLVLAVDDALGADRRALASEAVVAHELVWVMRARRAAAWQLRLPSVRRDRRASKPHRLLVLEGRGSICVRLACRPRV